MHRQREQAADHATHQRQRDGLGENDAHDARREKPSARSVPISRVRYATAAYIVFIAPNIAPIDRISVTNVPKTRITVVIDRRLFGVVVLLALRAAAAAGIRGDGGLERVERGRIGQLTVTD